MAPVVRLRELWCRRRLILVGAVVALVAALLTVYRVSPPFGLESKQYEAGLATMQVLVDSPQSQVVDLGEESPEVDGGTVDFGGLATRSRLLANLMANSPLHEQIARAAAVPANMLIVNAPVGPDGTPPVRPATSPKIKPTDREVYVLGLFVDEALPLLTVRAEAPDAASARRLAGAAVERLRAHVESVAAAADVPRVWELEVTPVGPAQSETVVKGPRRLDALLAFVVLLGLWCGAIVAVPLLLDAWREAARLDAAGLRAGR
jgi:hypothetical protein